MQNEEMKLPLRSIWAISLVLLAASAATVSYVGTFSRYMADDFCTAALQRIGGTWHVLANNYQSWSGRFAFFLTVGWLQGAGPWIARAEPGMLLLLWIAALWFLARRAFRSARIEKDHRLHLLAALLIPWAVLAGTPDLYQSFFWFTGGITYTLPLILLTVLLALLLPAGKPGVRIRSLIILILSFFAGGFSETYVTLQTALFLLIMLYALLSRRMELRWPAAAGVVGSALAMVVIVSAPGNAVRMGLTPDTPPVLQMAWLTVRFAAAAALKGLFRAPFLSAALLVLAFLAGSTAPAPEQGAERKRSDVIRAASVVLGSGLLVMAVVFPSVFATAAYPAERALISSQFVVVLGLAAAGFFAGRFLSPQLPVRAPRWITVAFLVLTLAGVGQAVFQNLVMAQRMQVHALQWDARHAEALAAREEGVEQITLPSLLHLGGLAELDPDPDNWINGCVAQFYGFHSVISR